jgi:3-hydroxyacyl-CoA dehydrogenase
MGRGIARAFQEAGLRVTLYDENVEAARTAHRQLAAAQQTLVQRGTIDAAQAAERVRRLGVADTLDGLAGHDLYIEAVFEEIEVKSKVLTALEGLAADAPLATNTSYLDIERLAGSLRSPERLVGMHFFSPAHRTRVLEVIAAERTSSMAVDTALAAAHLLGKQAIRSRPGPGFIGNRIYNAYRWQCELMLEEGALPHQIDAAMEEFGFAMGPFAVWDMSGLDIACRMRRATAADRDPAARHPEAAEVLCDRGRLGQKTGMGWYRYENGSRSPIVDPAVGELIETIARTKGVDRRPFSSPEISRRALLTMANEASLLLEEGISERVTDVDLMLVLGYGFPARRGGIGFWVRSQDRRVLERELDELALVTGHGFRRGDLGLLVEDKVGNAW